MKIEIKTDKAPAAIGPYSQATMNGAGLVFVSGQLPIDPATGEFAGADITAQTRQSLENIRNILASQGLGIPEDIENVDVFVIQVVAIDALQNHGKGLSCGKAVVGAVVGDGGIGPVLVFRCHQQAAGNVVTGSLVPGVNRSSGTGVRLAAAKNGNIAVSLEGEVIDRTGNPGGNDGGGAIGLYHAGQVAVVQGVHHHPAPFGSGPLELPAENQLLGIGLIDLQIGQGDGIGGNGDAGGLGHALGAHLDGVGFVGRDSGEHGLGVGHFLALVIIPAVTVDPPVFRLDACGVVPLDGQFSIQAGHNGKVTGSDGLGGGELHRILTTSGGIPAAVDHLQPEGVELSENQIVHGDGMPGEGFGIFRLSVGGVEYLPLVGLVPLHDHGKGDASVLRTHCGGESGHIGGALGGKDLRNGRGQLVQTADLYLNGIEGARGQLGKLGDSAAYILGVRIAVGVGADHAEQTFLNVGIHMNGQLAQFLFNGNAVYRLQVLRGIVHISPDAGGKQQAKEEDQEQNADGGSFLLLLFDDHRFHMGLGFRRFQNTLLVGPQELIHFFQFLVNLCVAIFKFCDFFFCFLQLIFTFTFTCLLFLLFLPA